MASPDRNPNSIPDYRKYPKGPNFLGIVIGASAVILLLLAVAWFVLRKDAGKLAPHGPNPTPNSMIQPASSNLRNA
jgi:hypothetical protein